MSDLILNLDKLTREELIEIRTAVSRRLYRPPDWQIQLKYRTAFRELLASALDTYWKRYPDATEWRGSAHRLCGLFQQDYDTAQMAKSIRFEKIHRFLQELSEEGLCWVEDASGTSYKVWIFPKNITQEKL